MATARTDLPSILTRALLYAASPRAQRARIDAPAPAGSAAPGVRSRGPMDEGLDRVCDSVHRLLSDLITLLLLELEGVVESPLNIRARARVRLGAPSRSRILSEWESREPVDATARLFPFPAVPHSPLVARDPEAFFRDTLRRLQRDAEGLEIQAYEIEELIRWLLPPLGRSVPEDDPVGWIHAHGQRNLLCRGPGNRLRFQVDRQRGRSHGILYTPPPLTEALVDALISVWKSAGPVPDDTLFGVSGASRAGASPPLVLDPACGSGQFLLSISRRLLPDTSASAAPAKPEEILSIFQSLHGVDVDSTAATLAALNLSFQAIRALCRTQGADPPLVTRWLQERSGSGFPWFLGSQIHQGNSLLLAATSDGSRFRWTDRFAEIFGRERPGFDIVIGNPPWISYGLRDRAGAEEEEAKYLRNLYHFGAQYKLSLYPIFIEMALRLTRPGGYHGFLVPDSFFTGRHFSKIRAHILETCHPLILALIESGPWPGVHVGHTAFYCVRRLPSPDPAPAVRTMILRLPAPAGRGRKAVPGPTLFGVEGGARATVPVDPGSLARTPHHAFRIFRNRADRELVQALERGPLRLEDLVDTYSGLIARHGQEQVTGPRDGELLLRDRSGRVCFRDPSPETKWVPSLHSGAEVAPFRVRWRGGAVYVPDRPEDLRTVYKSGFDLERYAREKLFLRQTGDRLVAARDAEGLLCLNNVHVLTASKESPVDMQFLCGLLLSEPLQRYYQTIALEAGRPLAQVDLATIRTLPFPANSSGTPYGLRRARPQTGRQEVALHRTLSASLAAGRPEGILEILARALAGTRGRTSTEAGAASSEIGASIVRRLVSILEVTGDAQQLQTAQAALDGSVRLLFGLPA